MPKAFFAIVEKSAFMDKIGEFFTHRNAEISLFYGDFRGTTFALKLLRKALSLFWRPPVC